MSNPSDATRLSRRAFLKTFGLTAGVLAATPLLSTSAGAEIVAGPALSRAVAAEPVRVGVLLPRSSIYPMLADNFLAGMQLALAQPSGRTAQQLIHLVAENYGISSAYALGRTQALIEQRQVDLIVSALSSNVAASLRPLLAERQIPLILSGVGANVTRPGNASPYIFRNKLSYWQSSWALGSWAARNQGRTALLATSFYESGYDAHYAFQLGFESAGGTLIGTQVSHNPSIGIDSSIGATLATIREQRPDMVCAFYCGQEANDFVRAYADSGLSSQIPLLGSGFLVDEQSLSAQGSAASGIKTVQPWAASLDTPENRQFVTTYQATFGRPADHFAVLGYDTARLIGTTLDASGGTRDAASWQQALSSAAFTSPRGPLTLNTQAGDLETPLYLREVRAGAAGHYNAIIARVEGPASGDAALAALRDDVKTGWSSAYLSI